MGEAFHVLEGSIQSTLPVPVYQAVRSADVSKLVGGFDSVSNRAWIVGEVPGAAHALYIWPVTPTRKPGSTPLAVLLIPSLSGPQVSSSGPFVSLHVTNSATDTIAALVCTGDGALFYWPDISNPQKMVASGGSAQISASVTAFTSVSKSSASADAELQRTLAVAGSSDGALWQVVLEQGAESPVALRITADVGAAGGSDSTGSSTPARVFGVLGSATKAALGYLRTAPSAVRQHGEAARDVAPLPGSATDVLVLTGSSLSCWRVPDLHAPVDGRASEQTPLWACSLSHSLAEAAQALPGGKPKVLRMAVHPDASSVVVALGTNTPPGGPGTVRLLSVALEREDGGHAAPQLLPQAVPLHARAADRGLTLSVAAQASRAGPSPGGVALVCPGSWAAVCPLQPEGGEAAFLSPAAGPPLAACALPTSSPSAAPSWHLLTTHQGIVQMGISDVLTSSAGLPGTPGPAAPPASAMFTPSPQRLRPPFSTPATAGWRGNASPEPASLSPAPRPPAGAEEPVRVDRGAPPDAVLRDLFDSYCAGAITAAQAGAALRGSGLFHPGQGEHSPFVAVSSTHMNTLAKHYHGPGVGGGGAGGAALGGQLEEKHRRHTLFLKFLQESECSACLDSLAETLVLEHGEQLTAMLRLRQISNHLPWAEGHMASDAMDADGAEEEDAGLAALKEAIRLAGVQVSLESRLLQERHPVEVFYSRPVPATGSANPRSAVQHLFQVAAQMLQTEVNAAADSAQGPSRWQRLEAVTMRVGGTLLQMLSAALEQRRAGSILAVRTVGPASNRVMWTAGAEVRGALRVIAEAAVNLSRHLRTEDAGSPSAPAVMQMLEGVSAPLLDSWFAAVAGESIGSDARARLHIEYCSMKRLVLPPLLESAIEAFNARASFAFGAPSTSAFDHLKALVASHRGYSELARICEETSDAEALHHYMATLKGTEDDDTSFCVFMMERLRERGEIRKLLDGLPDALNKELLQFLQAHPALLWVHQLRCGLYPAAADTLRHLAMSTVPEFGGTHQTIAYHRKLLCRRKLVMLAARPEGVFGPGVDTSMLEEADAALEERLRELDGWVRLCDIAERVTGSAEGAPMEPLELLDLCLESSNPGHTYLAFEVFVNADAHFCQSNRSRLEAVWRRAAEMSDWAALHDAQQVMGDAEWLALLEEQVVCQGAHCFYSGATHQSHFVAPMSQEDAEAIVVQHVQGLVEGHSVEALEAQARQVFQHGCMV